MSTSLGTCPLLLHLHDTTQGLDRLHNLGALLLGHALLHHLGHALDELLAVDQTQAEHALDLLDDLGLGGRVEGGELQGEERLLLRRGSGFFFFDGGSGGGRRGGWRCEGEVGDLKTGLWRGWLV